MRRRTGIEWRGRARQPCALRRRYSDTGLLAGLLLIAACQDGLIESAPAVREVEQQAALVVLQELDREALVALYDSTSGPNWSRNANWLTDAPVGEWYGVVADTAGRVVRLALRDNALEGTLPAQIGDLSELRSLQLDNNRLHGPIPSTVGRLGRLAALWLSHNQLTGPLPSEVAGLDSLRGLWLSGNRLTGIVPAGLRDLEVEYFEFAGNQGLCVPGTAHFTTWSAGLLSFAGPFCSEVDAETLKVLYEATDGDNWMASGGWFGAVDLSEWHGVQTDSLGRVSELVLSNNGLSGSLPRELGDLAALTRLDVTGNALWGPLPQSLANLSLGQLRYSNTELCVPDDAAFREWLAAIERHEGTGTDCPLLSHREVLEAFYWATGGPEWHNSDNWLTDAPLDDWYGVEADAAGSVSALDLSSNKLVGRMPAELGGLTDLEDLNLSFNYLLEGPLPQGLFHLANLRSLRLRRVGVGGPLPPAIGRLANLEDLFLGSGRITGPLPRELGSLGNLRRLDLSSNWITGPIPASLGNLSNLVELQLDWNELSGPIPASLGRLSQLFTLRLNNMHLSGEIPAELGRLTRLRNLYLNDNALTGSIPSELGNATELRNFTASNNALTGAIPASLGTLGNLSRLYLDGNALEGPLPESIGDLSMLHSLRVGDNPELSGPVPAMLAGLSRLEEFKAGNTGLCAPQDATLLAWLDRVPFHRLARCELGTAYLTQAVQSREFPVPLVAARPALLRVFVTSAQPTTAGLPPVRARFYHDGAEVHVADIPASTRTIPTEVDEGDLTRSANADIPAAVIRPGLEMVIEIDPEGTLDPNLGIPNRIPATGRTTVHVADLPDFQLTLVPFLYEASPDSAVLEITAGMAADPENHEMFAETRTRLPIGEWDIHLHDPVLTSTTNGFRIRNETEAIRVMEGRPGYWLSMLTPFSDAGLFGVAYGIGSWTSYSIPVPWVVAHELGHNMGLWHAPCGGAGGPDPLFPHPYGVIGSWGYDRENKRLVSPHTPDLMSYCGGQWISDYHHSNALRHRIDAEATAAFAPKTRSVLVWGGVGADGVPFLEPSFIVEAMSSLPPAGSDYVVKATTEDGSEAFSFSFDMPESPDMEDGRAGFVFAIPLAWTGPLAMVSLSGGRDTAVLDGNTDSPMTILRDPVTGEVRAILRRPVTQAMGTAGESNLEILFSKGIPRR